MGIIDHDRSVHAGNLDDAVIPGDGRLRHPQFIEGTLFFLFNLDQAEFRAASAKTANDDLIKARRLRRKLAHGRLSLLGESHHIRFLSPVVMIYVWMSYFNEISPLNQAFLPPGSLPPVSFGEKVEKVLDIILRIL